LPTVLLVTFLSTACSTPERIDSESMSPDVAARWAITDGPDDIYIRVAEPLDEFRYYCLDIPGSRDQLIGHQLNVHTCKDGMWHRDMIFSSERTAAGVMYMPEYDVCVETSGPEVDSTVHLNNCNDDALQKWDFSDGLIRPHANKDLCLTLSTVAGVLTTGGLTYPTGYKSRDMSLQLCSQEAADRQQWLITKPLSDLEAPILPDGSPADWRDWVIAN